MYIHIGFEAEVDEFPFAFSAHPRFLTTVNFPRATSPPEQPRPTPEVIEQHFLG